MYKKITIIALALSLPLAVAASSGAGGPGHFGHRGDKIERLSKELDLTADQKAKLEEIFKQEHEKFEAIRQDAHQQMKGVLNADQMAKFEELQKKRHEKWLKRREERMQQKPDASAN